MNNDLLFLIYSAQRGTTPPEVIFQFIREMQDLGFQIEVSNQGDGALRYILHRNAEVTN
ncbi:hypothetical protein HPT25_17080 [Bacillus sp. BRMEA1]|uniref:hypothetical protein n=1 Tax=Neobacillus endophyticus TaxID=2738405 RepID=UPI001565E32C|nr:hypothetical protein [Neobacillus endophyticus]NRD79074.1 hypothetical protein [Neobacillus endophyticus]